MIKEILEQLAPLDAQINALKAAATTWTPSRPTPPSWQSLP